MSVLQKYPKVIIVEGPDCVGKDMLISNLSNHYNNAVKVIHAGIPDNKNLHEYYYNGLIHDTLDAYYAHNYDAVIHNRSMYGEYVYGPKYRDEDKKEVAKLISDLELGQLKTFILSKELIFILLNSDNSDLLVKSSDGLSISNKKTDIEDEMAAFDEVFDLSSIKNKKKIYVNNGDSFRSKESIVKEAIDFIDSI